MPVVGYILHNVMQDTTSTLRCPITICMCNMFWLCNMYQYHVVVIDRECVICIPISLLIWLCQLVSAYTGSGLSLARSLAVGEEAVCRVGALPGGAGEEGRKGMVGGGTAGPPGDVPPSVAELALRGGSGH